jgi:hypothetical protein
MRRVHAIEAVVARPIPVIHRNRSGAKGLSHRKIRGLSMTSRPTDAAIDKIVAKCSGDIRSALKALLLVNEHLEAELQQLYAAVAVGGPFERGNNALH